MGIPERFVDRRCMPEYARSAESPAETQPFPALPCLARAGVDPIEHKLALDRLAAGDPPAAHVRLHGTPPAPGARTAQAAARLGVGDEVGGVRHATPPRSSASCDSRWAASSQYRSSISIPIARRPRLLAATSVVPEPINGSRTSPPPLISINHDMSSTGFSAGCPVGFVDDHRTRFISGIPRSSMENSGIANSATSSYDGLRPFVPPGPIHPLSHTSRDSIGHDTSHAAFWYVTSDRQFRNDHMAPFCRRRDRTARNQAAYQ